jgi:hypothetical protein
MLFGRKSRLAAAAIADISHGTGVFRDLPGNLTFCGVLTEENEFCGHIILRLVDQNSQLRIRELQKRDQKSERLDMGVTYLNFAAQKGRGPEQENRFSQHAGGQPRGINIATELKQSRLEFNLEGEKLRVQELELGDVIGREIGFGPLPSPGVPMDGLPLRPFPFEGVARYSFQDQAGNKVGAISTNVTEGRRIDIRFEKLPDEVGFRFGFFGPVTYGTGCFHGAQGLFYGASASFLTPPPGRHVVTHFYAAMLIDPDGKYRT